MNKRLQDYEKDMLDNILAVRYSVSEIGDSASCTFTKRKEGKGFPWTTILYVV
jgi:hypothetical protein